MTRSKEAFSISVVAGGQSSRMGKDKGLIPFMGKALVFYVIDQLFELSDDIYIISNDSNYPSEKTRVLPDKIPGIGALGGIHSSLEYTRHDICLVLACDMPFIHTGLIEYLLDLIREADAVVPELEPGQLEPFRAMYRKRCLPAIVHAIHAGERRATAFLRDVDAKFVPRPVLESINPSLDTFLNINTPQDLKKIEAQAFRAERKQGPEVPPAP